MDIKLVIAFMQESSSFSSRTCRWFELEPHYVGLEEGINDFIFFPPAKKEGVESK